MLKPYPGRLALRRQRLLAAAAAAAVTTPTLGNKPNPASHGRGPASPQGEKAPSTEGWREKLDALLALSRETQQPARSFCVDPLEADDPSEALALTPRKVRCIVSVSGRRPRGNFPSLKSRGRAQFESLVEEDALRVAEIAPGVTRLRTHPYVLALCDAQGEFGYTPDILIRLADGSFHFVEVKPAGYLERPRVVERLVRVHAGMRAARLSWSILSGATLREGDLQPRLKEVLKARPCSGRPHPGLDTSQWDPKGAAEPDEETAQRWAQAQTICDEIVRRAISSDPGWVLAAAAARGGRP
ncbi:MAG: hypothetical protein RI988_3047 [Pseudomonadota bacterium]|jgi:hypothetical protein